MTTTDAKYIDQYRELAAAGGNFTGLSVLLHRQHLHKLVDRFRPQTLLDYGSGRGDAYAPPYSLHADLGIELPTLYDPAFPEHAEKPVGKFDGVICSDVMEHIPERDVDDVIAELFGYATKFVWASVCCRPAKKTFPDGENMHVTIRPLAWWDSKFAAESRRNGGLPYLLKETL